MIQLVSAPVPDLLYQEDGETSERTTIYHRIDETPVATICQPANSPVKVSCYQGKGGFTVVVQAPDDLVYFLLPGSSLTLLDTQVVVPGHLLKANPARQRVTMNRPAVQSQTDTAMILGAGLATRFEPVSGETTGYAKPSVPLVGDRSVIRCIAENLKQDGFTHLVINTFYMPDSLKESLRDLPDIEITYIDEPEPSGTAGALRKLLDDPAQVPGADLNKPILIVQGDAVSDINVSELMAAHVANNAAVTIGCQYVEDADVDKFGIVATDRSGADGQSGRVIEFKEKPSLAEAGAYRLANTGFYILSPVVFPLVCEVYTRKQQDDAHRILDFANDLFPAFLDAIEQRQLKNAEGEMTFWAQMAAGYWGDIGNPTQYVQTVHDIYAGKLNLELPASPETYYDNGVIYWPGTREKVAQAKPALSGNMIVALPYCAG